MRFFWKKREKAPPEPERHARPAPRKMPQSRPEPPKSEPWDNRKILDHLLALSPTEFEHAVARLLSEMGYTSVARIGGAGDLGVDIVCKDAHGGLVAVQCKRYAPGKKVTAPNMATFFGMIVRRAARQGIYVTTSSFTKAAFDLATEQDIRTYDGDGLAKLFARHPAALGLGPPWEQQSGRTSYERPCRFCNRRIQMRVMPDGKWLPFDDVGIPHDCRSRRS